MVAPRTVPLTLAAIALLCGCNGDQKPGGQTGSELSCTADVQCRDALGNEYECGPNEICVLAEGPGDPLPDGGPVNGGNGCRVNDDCTREGPNGEPEECAGPNDAQVCGIPPREGCSGDGDCNGGDRCHAVFDGCSPDGIGSECRGGACVVGGCGPGLRCGASGACEALPCDDGYDCPAHMVCDPNSVASATAVFDRHHGCVVVMCTTDAQCDGLVCVNRFCQQSLGACAVPIAVP